MESIKPQRVLTNPASPAPPKTPPSPQSALGIYEANQNATYTSSPLTDFSVIISNDPNKYIYQSKTWDRWKARLYTSNAEDIRSQKIVKFIMNLLGYLTLGFLTKIINYAALANDKWNHGIRVYSMSATTDI